MTFWRPGNSKPKEVIPPPIIIDNNKQHGQYVSEAPVLSTSVMGMKFMKVKHNICFILIHIEKGRIRSSNQRGKEEARSIKR